MAALAGCGGGDGGAEGPTTPAPTVTVRVVDGDTGAPLPAAVVRAQGPRGSAERTVDPAGRADLEGPARQVIGRAPGYRPRSAAVRGGRATLELYRPELQSPQYGGGPARTRHVPAVAVDPPARGERPRWTFDARTLVEFPPAVQDGVAVFGTNSGRVFALDVDTGKVIWETRHRGYIAATPAIADGWAFVASMDGVVAAYRLIDGARRWTYRANSPVESSPLVVDGRVYFGTWSGVLAAVDAENGRLRWAFQAPGAIKGSAALAGRTVVVGDYAGAVHALDKDTGARRWVAPVGRRFYGGPGVAGGVVVIGDVGGAVYGLDAATGRQRWRHATGAYVDSSPAIAGGKAYIGSYNGRFQALDLRTGAVDWSFDAGSRISGSATVVDDVVYTAVLYRPGEPRRTFGLDVDTGAVRYRGDDGRYSPAVAAGRTLILVGTRLLYAFTDRPA